MSKTVVVAKCVACGHKKDVQAGEVSENDVPMCPKCYMPMVAEKTKTLPA